MKRLLIALLLASLPAQAKIKECGKTRTVYKSSPPTVIVKPTRKNHITLLAGTGYFETNYHVEYFQDGREPIVENHYDAIGGIMYQRFVTDWASMSFVGFTNHTLAMGIGFAW